MKKKFLPFALFILLLGTVGSGLFYGQEDQRFFDEAAPYAQEIRLAILHPSMESIRALLELRKHKCIPEKNFIVIGVFHEKQLEYDDTEGGYEEAIAYVRESHLDWIKFHKLRGDFDPEEIYQKNTLSEELNKIFAYSDGIILFGGADIPPSVYGEKTSLLTIIDTPYRSYLDMMVVFHLLGGWQDEHFNPFIESHPEFPVLAFCLGLQSLNVGTGGTLFQDIPSEIYHKKTVEDILALSPDNWHENPYSKLHPKGLRSCNMHRIRLLEKGKFILEWGFSPEDSPYVYSSHHQAIRKLGKGFKIIATSVDGKVPEAIEHETYPNILGVQFHPEASSLWDETKTSRLSPDDKEETNLFSILENNPPSLAFHQKIWSWFCEKLRAYHDGRKDQRP
jgi:putative glutamine amidotransferase